MTLDKEAAILRYCAAWDEPDLALRADLLGPIWDEQAVYCDPTVILSGPEALIAHIDAIRAAFPNSRLELTSGIDIHHDVARFGWRRVFDDGTVRPDSVDFVEFGDGAALRKVVGFFGPLPDLANQDA